MNNQSDWRVDFRFCGGYVGPGNVIGWGQWVKATDRADAYAAANALLAARSERNPAARLSFVERVEQAWQPGC